MDATDRTSHAVSDSTARDLYLVAWVDLDDNGVVDNPEYDYIHLQLR